MNRRSFLKLLPVGVVAAKVKPEVEAPAITLEEAKKTWDAKPPKKIVDLTVSYFRGVWTSTTTFEDGSVEIYPPTQPS